MPSPGTGATNSSARAETGLAWRPVPARALRAMSSAVIAFGACGCLGLQSCGGDGGYTCEGQISAVCADLTPKGCAEAKGCHEVPGKCVHLCEAPGTNCESSGCLVSADGSFAVRR